MQKNKLKPKILFLVQLPPPVHGSSLVNKIIVNNENVKSRYDIDIIEIQLAKNMEDLGNFSLMKIVNAFIIFFKLLKNVVLKKHELAYLTISPVGFAFYKDAILVFLIKIFSSVKIVFHIHGKGIKNEIKSNFKRKLYSFVFKNTEVIQLAEILYCDIKDIYHRKPYFLPNGIINTNIKKESSIIKNDSVTFIYLSNLMEEKGILVFLKSIKLLQSFKKNLRVYVVGSSADITINYINDYLKENKIKNVKVLGPKYGEDKYFYLNKSDVFILPTYYKNECFPLTILEAFQAGLAVISTNNGAIPDMVKNNINGFIVPQNDSDALAEKMKYLIENVAILNKMKVKNKLEYSEKYTEDIFIENYIKIIDQILAKKNGNNKI